MKKTLLFLLLAAGFTAGAQNFEKYYPYWEEGNSNVVITYDDGYAMVGFGVISNQEKRLCIIRTGLSGDTLWTKQLDVGNTGPSLGYISAYTIDGSGNIYLALTYADSADLIKLSPDWDLLWSKLSTPRINIRNITIAKDGNLLMRAGTENNMQILMKTDTESNILWTAPGIAENTYTQTPSILEKENGEIIVISTSDGMMDPEPAYSSIYTYTASGDLLETGFIDDGNGYGRILGNAFLSGNEIFGITYTSTGSFLLKYLPDGTLLLEKPMKLPGGYFANHLIYAADSSLIATSLYQWSVNNSILLHGMNKSGDSLWTRIIGDENSSFCFDIRQCPDSGIVISGCTEIEGKHLPYLVKTDATGNISNVGIDENKGFVEIKVYPNPANEYVAFESTEIKSGFISVSDIYGRAVAEVTITGEKTVWDTRNVQPGVYLYSFEKNGFINSGKVVITE